MRIAVLVGTLACIVSFALGSYFGQERGLAQNHITATVFKENVRTYLILEQELWESLPAYHRAQATPYLPQSQMTIVIFHAQYERLEDLARQIRDQTGVPHPEPERRRMEPPAEASPSNADSRPQLWTYLRAQFSLFDVG